MPKSVPIDFSALISPGFPPLFIVESILGKGEVHSSNLCGGTIETLGFPGFFNDFG